MPASAIERDRLLDQVTTRNRVLETIREMLETLAGPVTVAEGLSIALQSLRRGLQAHEVALITQPAPAGPLARLRGPLGTDGSSATPPMRDLAETALASTPPDGVARQLQSSRRHRVRAVAFVAAGGPTVLLATWRRVPPTKEETALLEDAAHSLRLALEREEACPRPPGGDRAAPVPGTAARVPVPAEPRAAHAADRDHRATRPACMQPDVTWDRESQQRFLDRIAAESARLGRLVDDLLDFSAIESGIMRLQADWCDIRLVLEAAIACLPPASAASVVLSCDPSLPVVWADHDRLEQVFVNLLNNAFRHNPPGTRVRVTARPPDARSGDQGVRTTASACRRNWRPPRSNPLAARRPAPSRATAIATATATATAQARVSACPSPRGSLQAHGGRIELTPLPKGTCFQVYLPVETEGDAGRIAGSRGRERNRDRRRRARHEREGPRR